MKRGSIGVDVVVTLGDALLRNGGQPVPAAGEGLDDDVALDDGIFASESVEEGVDTCISRATDAHGLAEWKGGDQSRADTAPGVVVVVVTSFPSRELLIRMDTWFIDAEVLSNIGFNWYTVGPRGDSAAEAAVAVDAAKIRSISTLASSPPSSLSFRSSAPLLTGDSSVASMGNEDNAENSDVSLVVVAVVSDETCAKTMPPATTTITPRKFSHGR
jgi:hypothetical protein